MPLSNTKLLLLNVNREGWHSGNMIYDMEAIKSACDVVCYGPGFPNYRHTELREIIEQIYGQGKPDIIYSYFTPNEKVGDVYINHYRLDKSLHNFPTGFDKVKGIRKVFGLSDFWARSRERYSEELGNSDFQYCFCCFAPPYSNPDDFYSFFDSNIRKKIRFIGLPRCIDANCFKDYGLDKTYDVITVGSMISFYPLRRTIHRKLSSKANIKYKNYPHCGVNFGHNGFVREEYAKAINQSRILASCGGKYHLLMNKVFESMACNTVYMGEKPYGEKELFLKEDENYICVNETNMEKKLDFYLSKPELLQKICENGHNTALAHHTIDKRAEDFVKQINML